MLTGLYLSVQIGSTRALVSMTVNGIEDGRHGSRQLLRWGIPRTGMQRDAAGCFEEALRQAYWATQGVNPYSPGEGQLELFAPGAVAVTR